MKINLNQKTLEKIKELKGKMKLTVASVALATGLSAVALTGCTSTPVVEAPSEVTTEVQTPSEEVSEVVVEPSEEVSEVVSEEPSEEVVEITLDPNEEITFEPVTKADVEEFNEEQIEALSGTGYTDEINEGFRKESLAAMLAANQPYMDQAEFESLVAENFESVDDYRGCVFAYCAGKASCIYAISRGSLTMEKYDLYADLSTLSTNEYVNEQGRLIEQAMKSAALADKKYGYNANADYEGTCDFISGNKDYLYNINDPRFTDASIINRICACSFVCSTASAEKYDLYDLSFEIRNNDSIIIEQSVQNVKFTVATNNQTKLDSQLAYFEIPEYEEENSMTM